MKKCPYCAEQIKDEAIKCKHCKSDLSQNSQQSQSKNQNKEQANQSLNPNSNENTRKLIKWIGIGIAGFLVLWLAVVYWYLSIPVAIATLIWWKTDWEVKKKLIGTGGAVVLLAALVGLNAYMNRTPSLEITSPSTGTTVQASKISIQGTVSPDDSNLTIGGKKFAAKDGTFEQAVDIPDKVNDFSVTASNSGKSTTTIVTVNREYVQPSLSITSPDDGATIQSNKATIEGEVSPAYAKLKVGDKSKSTTDGTFSHEVDLPNSTNQIAVAAFDGDKSASTTLTLNREFVQPTLEIEKPESGTTVQSDEIEFTGTVEPYYSDFSIDGETVSPQTDSTFSYTEELDVGRNVIELSASDGNKTTSETVVVTRELTEQQRSQRKEDRRNDYFAELAPIYTTIGNASEELSRLLGNNPNVITWSNDRRIAVGGYLGIIQAQYDKAQKISPPESWSSYHRDTLGMLRKYDRMAGLFAEGIDEINVTKMQRALQLQQEAIRQMEDLRARLTDRVGQSINELD